ncbi:MAG: metal ABC transporter permease [Cryomorphaceae bacterium]|nr:metal ABC transporter permease [Cryomorphaceae bacterium]
MYLLISMDPNLQFVLLGILLLSATASLVGTYNFFQKQALVGETIAHAMLPGVVIAFMISGVKNPWHLLIGAGVSGWFSVLFIEWIKRETKVKADAAMAIALTFFFGIGVMLMVRLQHQEVGNQAGLDHYLFGKAAAMTDEEGWVFLITALVVLTLMTIYHREIKLLCFNRDYAQSLGVPVKRIDVILSFMTILVIATGIKAAGIILMAALVIAPAAAASFWTRRYRPFLILSVLIGVLGGVSGVLISFTYSGMPTGPWIIVFLFAFSLLSMLFAPKRGFVHRLLMRMRARKKIRMENLLKKEYYRLYRNPDDSKVLNFVYWKSDEKQLIPSLKQEGFMDPISKYKGLLTHKGYQEGKRIYRLHCLWEIYLWRKMNIAAESTHSDAEYIEHIITPEVEKMIMDDLGYCERFEPLAEIHEYLSKEETAHV